VSVETPPHSFGLPSIQHLLERDVRPRPQAGLRVPVRTHLRAPGSSTKGAAIDDLDTFDEPTSPTMPPPDADGEAPAAPVGPGSRTSRLEQLGGAQLRSLRAATTVPPFEPDPPRAPRATPAPVTLRGWLLRAWAWLFGAPPRSGHAAR
jgi:hypothetical protein